MKTRIRHCRRTLLVLSLTCLGWTNIGRAQAGAPPAGAVRAWTDTLGRVSRAAFVSANDTTVVLRLENGAQASLPLAILSKADQDFIQQQKAPATRPGVATTGGPAGKPMTWPSAVTIDPKALNIVTGEQNANLRQYHYESGSFEFTANAPLNPSVMKDVAIDFELTRALFEQLPWGWQPKPKAGAHFRVFLTETPDDFYALGGSEHSSGGSKDDYVYKKMSSLGLKKIGQRYSFDPRNKDEGEVLGLTFRILLGDMRPLTYPWSALGMEEFIENVAYHKGTMHFTGLERALKDRIEERAKHSVNLDVTRLIKNLHMPRKEEHGEILQLRREYYFDGMLLIYFFGFLDGDGKGTRLHQYFESMAKDSLAWRAAKEASGTPPPRNIDARSLELLDTLIGGRTDAQLREEMVTKFRAIGVKLG